MDPIAELAKKKNPINKQELARAANKRLRIAGKEHINTKGEVVSEKKPGPDCKCRRKCFQKIDEEIRNKLFKAYYSLKSYDEQNAYLYGLIKKIPIKRKTSETSTRRTCTFQYFIRVNGEEIQVCLTALEHIHGVRSTKIRHLCEKLAQNVLFPRDERGYQVRAPKVSEEKVELVKNHIYSIIRSDRARDFLKDVKANNGPDVNMAWMHKDFLDIHDPTYEQKLADYEKIHGPSDSDDGDQRQDLYQAGNWQSQQPGGSRGTPAKRAKQEASAQPSSSSGGRNSATPAVKRRRKPKGRPEPLVLYWFYSKMFHEVYTMKEANALRKKAMDWKSSGEFVQPKAARKPRPPKGANTPARAARKKCSQLAGASSTDMYGMYPKILQDLSRLESHGVHMSHFQGQSSFTNEQRAYLPGVGVKSDNYSN